MPRMTKAERERIKVTCLWCENIATTHLVCLPCQGPLSDADKARYLRAMALDMERAQRKCKCGALIPYEARQGTKWCTYCGSTAQRLQRLHHERLTKKQCIQCGVDCRAATCPKCKARSSYLRSTRIALKRIEHAPSRCKACRIPIVQKARGVYRYYCETCRDKRSSAPKIVAIRCKCGAVMPMKTRAPKWCKTCTAEKLSAARKKETSAAKLAGICTRCKENLAATNRKYCSECLFVERSKYTKKGKTMRAFVCKCGKSEPTTSNNKKRCNACTKRFHQ